MQAGRLPACANRADLDLAAVGAHIGVCEMIGLGLALFVVVDGLVRCNLSSSGAIGRGVLVAALVVAWIAWLWRAGVRLPMAGAALAGILAAYAISGSYHNAGGVNVYSWLIYAGAWWGQWRIQRDWARDFGLAGLALAGFVLLAYPMLSPGSGPLNRNMIGGALAALTPAALILPARSRLASVVKVAAIMAAIALTGSRGTWVAASAAAVVLTRPWRILKSEHLYRYVELSCLISFASALAGGGLIGLLIAIRPGTIDTRLGCATEVVSHWVLTNPLFGLGPGFSMMLTSSVNYGEWASNAHNSLLTLGAMGGYVGVVVIGLSIVALAVRRKPCGSSWQWATLAAIAAHSLIEENASWWPVGLVAALVAGSIENDN